MATPRPWLDNCPSPGIKLRRQLLALAQLHPIFSIYLGILLAQVLLAIYEQMFGVAGLTQSSILGAGLRHGSQIGRTLANRLDAALKLAHRQSTTTTLIVTGGQGPDEHLTEG